MRQDTLRGKEGTRSRAGSPRTWKSWRLDEARRGRRAPSRGATWHGRKHKVAECIDAERVMAKGAGSYLIGRTARGRGERSAIAGCCTAKKYCCAGANEKNGRRKGKRRHLASIRKEGQGSSISDASRRRLGRGEGGVGGEPAGHRGICMEGKEIRGSRGAAGDGGSGWRGKQSRLITEAGNRARHCHTYTAREKGDGRQSASSVLRNANCSQDVVEGAENEGGQTGEAEHDTKHTQGNRSARRPARKRSR